MKKVRDYVWINIYFQCIAIRAEYAAKKDELMEKIEKLHSAILLLCPNKTLTLTENILAKHGMNDEMSFLQFENL